MKAMINTAKLLEIARKDGWETDCIALLTKASMANHSIHFLPEFVSYESIKATGFALNDMWLLGMTEAIQGIDYVQSGGIMLWHLAHDVFIKEVPRSHPGYIESLRLLRVLRGYLSGILDAEIYIKAAYTYRVNFCRVWQSDADPAYADLFEAMPCNGLSDSPSVLRYSWDSFGRYLATRQPGYDLLTSLEDSIETAVFIQNDEESNDEAREAAYALIDIQHDNLCKQALAGNDGLSKVIDNFMWGAL